MREGLGWPDLPGNWELVKLGHVVEIPTGLVDPTNAAYADLRLIAPNHVESHTARLLKSESADDQGASSGKFLAEAGEIIYSKIRPALNKVVIAPERCLCSADMYPVRPKPSMSDARFMLYTMLSGPFLQRTIDESMRVAMPKVNRDSLAQIKVPIPPLPTQRAIASFLDRETEKIDTLLEKKRRLLELLEEKGTALITRAVTKGLDPDVPMKDSGVEWIGEIPEHWEVTKLKHLVPPTRPITYGIVQAGPNIPEGVPYIRTSDMAGSKLPTEGYQRTSPEIDEQYARSRVRPGDVVVAIRATVGKALIVPQELGHANLTQGTARVAPGPLLSARFLRAGLAAEHTQQRFDALAKGATFREITLGMLRDLEFVLPPSYEQKKLLAELESQLLKIRGTRRAVRRAISLLQEYRTALISAAVTGKIDVRDKVPA